MKNPISAEINMYFDSEMSNINFNENIARTKNEGIYLYSPGYELTGEYNIEELIHIHKNNSKQNLISALGDFSDYSEYTRDELISEVYGEYDNIEDFIYACKGAIEFTKKYRLIETRGYSQGDYAEVIVINEYDFKGIDECVSNLFWDSPISGNFTIIAGQDFSFELCEVESLPQYLNYPQNVDFVNEEILKFIKKRFKNAPAIDNIIKATKDAFISEIEY